LKQLLYLDSLDADYRTVHKDYVDESTATVLPRVKAWNDGLIKAVIKKDRIRKGVYGKLRVSFTLLSEQNFVVASFFSCSCPPIGIVLPKFRELVAF
jgi:hypothetical protein